MLPKSLPPTCACQDSGQLGLKRVVPGLCAILILALLLAGCVGVSSSGSNSQSGGGPLTISAKLPNATVGALYTATVSVNGGKPPYAFSISSGTLPPGVSFSRSTGGISGTPITSGSFSFTVQTTDSSAKEPVSALATLSVAPGSLAISPSTVAVPSRGTQQFQAALNNTSISDATWTASQGTVSSSGLFTAPSVSVTTQVTVTATRSTYQQTATALVTVAPTGTVAVSIAPATATLSSAKTQQFTATVINSNNTAVTWSAALGTISNAGLFTAPTVTQNTLVNVTATSVADPTKNAVAAVTVQPPPPVIVSIAPTSATVVSSATYQFSATVQNTSNTAVTWSASIGSIAANGLFTAPAVKATTTGTVTATSMADQTKSASAAVTVTPPVTPPLTITTVSLPIATSGVPYVATLAATGGSLPYGWNLSSGQLPTGLGLTSAGLISGTTTTTGAFTFTVRATDSSSPAKTATQSLTLTVDAAVVGGLSSTFYSMHINHPSTPWPSVPIGGERLWDADNATWALTNTSPGVYDWTAIDDRLADAQTHGIDILYDLGRTPVWAQCSATTSSPCAQTSGCAYSTSSWGGGPGQCYWPEDLNVDGTGTNQHWKDWVTAVATHSVNSSTAHIKYYEIWNEPNDTDYFRGTTAQLVRMTQDAACIIKGVGAGCTKQAIDPNALIVTPAATYGGSSINDWLNGFLGSGGAQVVDVIAFHGYNGQSPEKVPPMITTITSGALTTYNQTGKPLFDTEYSWGLGSPITDPDQQAGFVARSLLLHWSSAVDRVYWYSWDTSGTMWTPTQTTGCTTPDPSGNGYTCQSTAAYAALQNWTLGATLNQACSSVSTVWTCGFTKPGGYQALAVWDTSQTCNNGFCTSSTYTIPKGAGYIHYRDLAGHLTTITGSTVWIGYKPILLENQ
jgi:hypothetical protein